MFLMAGWQNALNQLRDFLSDKRKMSVADNTLCLKNSYSFNSEVLQIMYSCLISYQVTLLWEYISVTKYLACSTVLLCQQN
jgi:hypothetical protein